MATITVKVVITIKNNNNNGNNDNNVCVRGCVSVPAVLCTLKTADMAGELPTRGNIKNACRISGSRGSQLLQPKAIHHAAAASLLVATALPPSRSTPLPKTSPRNQSGKFLKGSSNSTFFGMCFPCFFFPFTLY